MADWSPPPWAPDADRSPSQIPHGIQHLTEGPRASRRARRRAPASRRRPRAEPAARGADLIEIGQVLDHRDPRRKEDRVRGVLGAGRAPPRLADRVTDAMVG